MHIDFAKALYVVCLDYHSGKHSRGYRILTRLKRKFDFTGAPKSLHDLIRSNSDRSVFLYKRLEKFAETL